MTDENVKKTTKQIIMEGVAQRMRDHRASIESNEYPYNIPDNVNNVTDYIKEYVD